MKFRMENKENIIKSVMKVIDLRIGQRVYIPFRVTRNSRLQIKQGVIKVITVNILKQESELYVIVEDENGVSNSYELSEIRLSEPEAIREIVRTNIVEELDLAELRIEEKEEGESNSITQFRDMTNRGVKIDSGYKKKERSFK